MSVVSLPLVSLWAFWLIFVKSPLVRGLVALPRNHLYRTSIRFLQNALRSGGKRHHVRDLARELDGEAIIGGADRNALDEPTQDLKRFRLCGGLGKCLFQLCDLLPIDSKRPAKAALLKIRAAAKLA